MKLRLFLITCIAISTFALALFYSSAFFAAAHVDSVSHATAMHPFPDGGAIGHN